MRNLKSCIVMLSLGFFCLVGINSVSAATLVVDDDAEPAVSGLYLVSNYADASACIQAAFDAAASGDTVIIREGNYGITRQVSQKGKDLTITGSGEVKFNINLGSGNPGFYFAGKSVKDSDFASDAKTGESAVALKDAAGAAAGDIIRIYNNTLWCPDDYPTHKAGELYEIKSVSGNNITLETPLIRDYAVANGSKAMLYRPVSVKVSGLSFYGAGAEAEVQGLTLEFCKDSSISQSHFENNGQAAIYLRTCSNVDVGDNTILSSNMTGYGYGVAPVNASATINIHDNVIRNCRHAITSGDSNDYGVNRDIFITENELHRDNGKSAVVDAHPTTINYTVTGNTIYAEGVSAFNDGTIYSVFSNNKVYGGVAVTHRGNITDSVKIITGNTIEGADSAIFSEGKPSFKEIAIKDNVLVGGSGVDGILMSGAISAEKLTITGNSIKNSKNGMAITLINAGSSAIDISGNTIENAQRSGIYLNLDATDSSSVRTISGNIIKNADRSNGEYQGISLVNVDYADIDENQITDSTTYVRYGIYEDVNSDYNEIKDNLITGTKTGAVKVSGAHTVASNNGNINSPSGTEYVLTVENGTGDGSYETGEQVQIIADAVPASTGSPTDKLFFRWAWGGDDIAEEDDATTTITMPAGDLTVVATYRYAGTMGAYGLKVKDGSGTGYYAAGSRVDVTAAAAPAGKVFDKWTGDTDAIYGHTLSTAGADITVYQPSIKVSIPYTDTTLTATYKDAASTDPIAKYTLTVNKGSGSGSYEAGKKVEISANMTISELVFVKWTGDIEHLTNPNAFTTYVNMPAKNISVTATYKNSPETYSLTVNQGSGDGSCIEGSKVTIKADAAAAGKVFDKWTGDTEHLGSATSATAIVTMPAEDIELTATYKDAVTYTLTINGGTGDGEYVAGKKVIITADAPAEGKVFDKWTGDTAYAGSALSKSTMVTMPEKAVTLTATYRDASLVTYRLKVNGGSGDGNYEKGTEVTITADAVPEGKVFMKWAGDLDCIADVGASTTKVTMPGRNVVITAVYKGQSSNTITLPDGTLIKLPESPKIYVIINGEKKWISTPEVFEQLGYEWMEITSVTDSILEAIQDLEDNLIKLKGDYKVYLVTNGVRRHIPNPQVFLNYGFNWDDIKEVDESTAAEYKDTYLVRESGEDEVYYLNGNGVRKHIPTAEIFDSYGDKWGDIQIVSKTEMESYPISDLVQLEGSNDVYTLTGNMKKLIPDPETFKKYKLDWSKIIKINKAEFDYYTDGGELK